MPESPEQLNVKKPQEDMEKKPEDLEMQPEDEPKTPETPEKLEKLAQEKIESAEKELEGLSGSEKKIDDCNNSVNLPANKLEEIKATSGVVEKLGTVNEKGRSLLEEMKAKMKTAVAIGMAAMTFAGAGGIKEAEAGVKLKTTVGIESIETSQQKAIKAKREKELLEKYEKAKKEAEDSIYRIATRKELHSAEKIKNELIEHISSQEYLNKLKSEFGGSDNRAKGEQARRIENLKKVNINIASSDELNEELKKRLNGQKLPGNFIKANGFYDPVSHETFVSFDDSHGALTSLHELLHASTRGVDGITYRTKNTLVNSYENQGYLRKWIKDEKDEYFSDPTERLVRKQILDRELEKLNIKKYGEEFTDEHYKKMMDAYKKGMFSHNAKDFIKRTKKDPKIFMQIFNEIARNEEEKENPSSLV